jgi:L-arabinose isomerase
MLAASKLLADGYGFGGEGDVTSAAAVTLLQRLTGAADFFESWGMDFEVGAVLKNHMGEGNLAFAREDMPKRLVRKPFGFGGSVEYNAVPSFVLREGDATLMNLTTGQGGGICIIASEGKVVDFKPVTGVDSPHGKFRPDRPFKEYLSAYAQAGGTHHGALCYGRRADDIRLLCGILDLKFTQI